MTIKHDKLFFWVASALMLGCSSSGSNVGGSGGSTGTTVNPGGSVTGGGGVGGPSGTIVPGLVSDNPGGTWTPTPDAPLTAKPGKGAAGTTGAAGATSSSATSCAPGMVGAVVVSCGYPYASSNALTSVTFNESEVLRAIRPSISTSGGIVSLLYGDEHAMTLGVRQVVVTGGSTKDYPVSPLTKSPDSILNPITGTNALTGDESGLDPSLRPLWPVLYVTDISNDPANRAGDWQMGGRPINPNAVFGTWKSAVRTVDKSTSPPTVSITPDADPAKNDWNFILKDPVPAGIKNEGWSAEVRWGVTFQPGHAYRLQVIVHDGDQNKVGGDCGEACTVFCPGGDTTTPPPSGCTGESQTCGEGMGLGGGYLGCPEGESCVNGCCTTLICPTGATPCGQLGLEGETVRCLSGESCVSGCCLTQLLIP